MQAAKKSYFPDLDAGKIRTAQSAVEALLDKERDAAVAVEEIAAIADPAQRYEAAANLIEEMEGVVSLAKELEDSLARARKRMSAKIESTIGGLQDEIEKEEGGEFETENWKMKIRLNPPSVVVDDFLLVPKKYRSEPKPLPPPEEWPVNKGAVKQALTKEHVAKIAGVHVEQSARLEIKAR